MKFSVFKLMSLSQYRKSNSMSFYSDMARQLWHQGNATVVPQLRHCSRHSNWRQIPLPCRQVKSYLDLAFFLTSYDRWLAIDRDDMTSEVQIPVSIPDGEANAGFLFKQGIFNKLKDDHLFWSVFSRPVRSRYEYVIQKLQGYLTFLSSTTNTT